MKIRVQDPADLAGLVDFLQRRDCVARGVGPNTIEVYRLSSVRHTHIRPELQRCLEEWRAAHPESQAEFVE